ncbi:MAG: HU family DNA-binding protein [Ignavibacteria bacterium]|nr:HU family DNA-binding protein [Ignavibacteria bacterium]
MNKEELIGKLAADLKITKVAAKGYLEGFMDVVKKALKKGDKIALIGFGTFAVGKRKARTGRNPRTGAKINIPAKKVVRFKAGKDFVDYVNGVKK